MAKRTRSIAQFLNDVEFTKGADIASATSITPGKGVFFDVTGTTTVTYIKKPRSGKARLLVIKTTGSQTWTHGGGSPGAGFAALHLVGAANVSMTASDILILLYDGTVYRQLAPTLVA